MNMITTTKRNKKRRSKEYVTEQKYLVREKNTLDQLTDRYLNQEYLQEGGVN